MPDNSVDTSQPVPVALNATLPDKKVLMTIEGQAFPVGDAARFAETPAEAREKLLARLPVFVQACEETGVDVPFVLSCAGLFVVFLPQPGGKVTAERAKNGADVHFLIAEWEAAHAATGAEEGSRTNG